MSKELRIGLVAEGPTDYEVIQAALKAVLPNPFILVQFQPEATQPQMGTGWCGVLKWCDQIAQRHQGPLLEDPTLQVNPYDLLIIHLDVDVALMSYSNCGEPVGNFSMEKLWKSLPCAKPCPPVSDTVQALHEVLTSWLGQVKQDSFTIFCLPAQSSGTWLAAAVQSPTDPLLAGGECDPNIETSLAQLKKNERIKKKVKEYRAHAPQITQQWAQVKQICSQAEQFESSVLTAINLLGQTSI